MILNNINKLILSSHIHIVTKKDKVELSNNVLQFLNEAYKDLPGGNLSFINEKSLIRNSFYWEIVYYGKIDNVKDFEMEKCLALTIYNKNHGLKCVAGGINKFLEKTKWNRHTISALKRLLNNGVRYSWMEVSDKMEDLKNSLGHNKYIIDPKLLEPLFSHKNFEIDEDGKHYFRNIGNDNIRIRKIAMGNIKL